MSARNCFVAWLRWYMATHPRTVPTRTELARRLGLNKATVTLLLKPASTQAPSLETLVAARELTGLPLDVLFLSESPELEK